MSELMFENRDFFLKLIFYVIGHSWSVAAGGMRQPLSESPKLNYKAHSAGRRKARDKPEGAIGSSVRERPVRPPPQRGPARAPSALRSERGGRLRPGRATRLPRGKRE